MNCLIVDDDQKFSRNLLLKLDEYLQSNMIEHQISIYNDHFEDQDYLGYKIIFLDIDLIETNGITLAKNIKRINNQAIFIFVSSLNELVFEALTINPLFFIRKDNFEDDFNKLKSLLITCLKIDDTAFIININGRMIKLQSGEVKYLSIAGHDATINLVNCSYTMRSSMKEILKLINDEKIVQVSKSNAVNLRHVAKMDKNIFIMKDNNKIEIGRAYKNNVVAKYERFLLDE